MYVDRVPNRGSPPAVLLREARREGGKIRKRTLANLSHWPEHKIESLKRLLRGETLVAAHDVFAVETSMPHGHVEAVLGTIGKLGLDHLITSKPSRQRDLVVAMIAERLIAPSSKLATTGLWSSSTLAEEVSVGNADVNELYQALDWLLARQHRIEAKLAARHLKDGAVRARASGGLRRATPADPVPPPGHASSRSSTRWTRSSAVAVARRSGEDTDEDRGHTRHEQRDPALAFL